MIWHKHLLWLSILLLFLIEGSLIPWLIPQLAAELKLMIVPQFALVMILYTAIYLHRNMAIAMGLVFGLLHDMIFYGHVLGAYAFSMGLCAYVAALLLRNSHVSWYVGIGCIGLALILFDGLIYGLYKLFQITSVSPGWHAVHAVIPSFILNLTFALAVYYPVIKVFAKIEKYIATEDSDSYQPDNS